MFHVRKLGISLIDYHLLIRESRIFAYIIFRNMKKILTLTVPFIFASLNLYGQSCTINAGNVNTDVNFSTYGCSNDDVVTINNLGGSGRIIFDQNISIKSLEVNYKNGNNPVGFYVPTGIIVEVEDDIVFDVNSTPQAKFLDVDGTLRVGGTIDFGNTTTEIDGSGTIEADRIINAGNATCEDDTNCPNFNVPNCDGGGLCGEDALPIELKSFTASKSGKNIDLNWVTAKEENFSHFEIERSLDQENWSQIGLVQGLGESNSDVFYDFTDRNAPFGVIYYRLKSVDIDASYEYSPVVKIEVGFEGKLAVSPNPVQDASNLKIQVPSEFRDKLAYVGLFDLNGTKVQEFRDFNTDGSLQINQQLKAGMYILKVNHNGLQENIRVVVQ